MLKACLLVNIFKHPKCSLFSQIVNSQHWVHLFYTTKPVENSKNHTMSWVEGGATQLNSNFLYIKTGLQ